MIFLDMDGTVCESRQKISKEMKELLSGLNVAIISGASKEQMREQLDGLDCIILAQSGNDTPIWRNELNDDEKEEAYEHMIKITDLQGDMLEDRGCQMTLSLVGHHAPIRKKKIFDPDASIRKELLKSWPFFSETLTCQIAGTTCLDYTRKNGKKGNNIDRWIIENGLDKDECIYYGDALFPGGNDESVIGIIKTVAVSGPDDLLKKLNENRTVQKNCRKV
jgi:hypothetical protein